MVVFWQQQNVNFPTINTSNIGISGSNQLFNYAQEGSTGTFFYCTVPAGATYIIDGYVSWDNTNSNYCSASIYYNKNYNQVDYSKRKAHISMSVNPNQTPPSTPFSTTLRMNQNDYFYVSVWQNSGGGRLINSEASILSITRIN